MTAFARAAWPLWRAPGPALLPAQRNLGQLLARRWGRARLESTKAAPSPPPTQATKVPPRVDNPVPIQNPIRAPLPVWHRFGRAPIEWAAGSFGRAQRRSPYATQLVSGLLIALCADASVQRLTDGPHDVQRTARALVIGGLIAVPNYEWFRWLANNFNYTSRLLSLAAKVGLNQIVFTPLFNTYFFGMQALLAGEGVAAAWERVCLTVPTSVVNSCKVWPIISAINFAWVPIEYRILFSGVFAVAWQTYLMFLNLQAEDAEAGVPVVSDVAELALSKPGP